MVAVVQLHVVEISQPRPLQRIPNEVVMGLLVDAARLVVSADAVHGHLAIVGFAVFEDRLGRPVPGPLVAFVPVIHPAEDGRLYRGRGHVSGPDDDGNLAAAVSQLPARQASNLGRGLRDGIGLPGSGPAGPSSRQPDEKRRGGVFKKIATAEGTFVGHVEPPGEFKKEGSCGFEPSISFLEAFPIRTLFNPAREKNDLPLESLQAMTKHGAIDLMKHIFPDFY